MFELSALLTFMTAAIIIVLIPGPGQALVISQLVSNGKQHSVFTSLGLNTGTFFHACLMAIGLSAILATSFLAYEIIKVWGALYLIYLGVASLRKRNSSLQIGNMIFSSVRQTYFRGLFTGVLNPKVALFFISFLPQFVNPGKGSVALQFIILGSTIALMGFGWDMVIILLLDNMRERFFNSDFFKNKLKKWLGFIYSSGL